MCERTMRKSLFIVLMLLLSINCTSGISENQLVGNWKIIKFVSNTPDLSPELVNGARENALSSTYTIKIDKTYNIRSSQSGTEEYGKWTFNQTKNLILFSTEQDGENILDEYEIVSINEKEMVWFQDLGELGKLKMILKRE
jgi:hypothetical protein